MGLASRAALIKRRGDIGYIIKLMNVTPFVVIKSHKEKRKEPAV